VAVDELETAVAVGVNDLTVMRNRHGILIVEDSDDDVLLFSRAWTKAGIDIPFAHVSDGADAIRYLETLGLASDSDQNLPKVILTDLKMPRVSGFELLKFLQQNSAFESVIALVWSNSNEISDVRRAYELGVRCYFPKPASEKGWRMLVDRVREFHELETNSGAFPAKETFATDAIVASVWSSHGG